MNIGRLHPRRLVASSVVRPGVCVAACLFACFAAQAQSERGDREIYLSVDVNIEHSVFESVARTTQSIQGVADVRFGYFITDRHFIGILSSTNFFLQRSGTYNPLTPSIQVPYRYLFRTGHGHKALPFIGISPGIVFADNDEIITLAISPTSSSAVIQQLKAKYPDPTAFNMQLASLGTSLTSGLQFPEVRHTEFSVALEVGLKCFLSRRFAVEVAWRPTYQNLTPIYYQAQGDVLWKDPGVVDAGFGLIYVRTGPKTVSTRSGEGPYNTFEKTKSTVAFGFSFLF